MHHLEIGGGAFYQWVVFVLPESPLFAGFSAFGRQA
jgi:hypothetical protein